MATHTENYEMTLPEREDAFNIQDYNENFETIDTLMGENEAVVNEMNEKLGTPDEGETVFSLLKKSGGSVVKSIQYKTLTMNRTESTASIELEPVDTTKSIVLFERLYDRSTGTSKVTYTLETSALQVTASFADMSDSGVFGFWIIEFN